MVLSKERIRELNVVRDLGDDNETLRVIDATDPRYREMGFDLTIGSIYVPKVPTSAVKEDGDSARGQDAIDNSQLVEEYQVPSQGVVVIFSREVVVCPPGLCGYAMPKTGLCDDGLLVLNTGIVDPNFKGFLSGTTINFANSKFPLKKGMPFLRLVFEPIAPQQGELMTAELAAEQQAARAAAAAANATAAANAKASDATAAEERAKAARAAAGSLQVTAQADTGKQPEADAAAAQAKAAEDEAAAKRVEAESVSREAKAANAASVTAAAAAQAVGSYGPKEQTAYINAKIRKAIDFPYTFLNVPRTVRLVGEQVLKDEREFLSRFLMKVGAVVAIVALVVGVVQIVPLFVKGSGDDKKSTTILIDHGPETKALKEEFEGSQRRNMELIESLKKNTEQLQEKTKAIQEQRVLIESLERRLEALEKAKPPNGTKGK
jgi:deoxycytidine triphosphate deaminase